MWVWSGRKRLAREGKERNRGKEDRVEALTSRQQLSRECFCRHLSASEHVTTVRVGVGIGIGIGFRLGLVVGVGVRIKVRVRVRVGVGSGPGSG